MRWHQIVHARMAIRRFRLALITIGREVWEARRRWDIRMYLLLQSFDTAGDWVIAVSWKRRWALWTIHQSSLMIFRFPGLNLRVIGGRMLYFWRSDLTLGPAYRIWPDETSRCRNPIAEWFIFLIQQPRRNERVSDHFRSFVIIWAGKKRTHIPVCRIFTPGDWLEPVGRGTRNACSSVTREMCWIW